MNVTKIILTRCQIFQLKCIKSISAANYTYWYAKGRYTRRASDVRGATWGYLFNYFKLGVCTHLNTFLKIIVQKSDFRKSQDGGRPPSWISKSYNNSLVDWDIGLLVHGVHKRSISNYSKHKCWVLSLNSNCFTVYRQNVYIILHYYLKHLLIVVILFLMMRFIAIIQNQN